MPVNVYFNHVNLYTNDDLNVYHNAAGEVVAGEPTTIDVTLHNDGDDSAPLHVHLYWCGPNAGAPAEAHTDIGPTLTPSAALGVGFPMQVDGHESATQSVTWTPSTSILGTTASAHGCLFAQVEVDPIPIILPGGLYNPTDWNPSSNLNAQHNLTMVQAAAGTKSVKFALGVGHSLPDVVQARVRVAPIPPNDKALMKLLQARPAILKALKQGRLAAPADAGLTLGLERLVARPLQPIPQLRVAKTTRTAKLAVPAAPAINPVRLGHTGVLSEAIAKALTAGRRAANAKLELQPRELRQTIVDVTIPRSAKKNDFFAVAIHNEALPQTDKSGKKTKARVLGSLALVVQIV